MRTSTLLGLLLLAATGCKEKDDSAGSDTTDPIGDTDTDTTDTDTTDTDTVDTDTTDTDTTDTTCWVGWAEGECYDTDACPLPTSPGSDSLEFLNQCSDAPYADFDNAARIPSTTWKPGDPLPNL